jgi:hypothetical protein
MELSVFVRQTDGNHFRAWCEQPLQASVEGATREEALAKLRDELEAMTRGVEVVRLTIGPRIPSTPTWPDDQITRDWLAGIAAAREAADKTPDPWEVPDATETP